MSHASCDGVVAELLGRLDLDRHPAIAHRPSIAHALGDDDDVVTEEDVRRLALSLPATTEKTSYGTPGFRVKDKLFARIREEGDVLVAWVGDLGEKEALIASEPDKFFTTPHYDGHPTVLVRFGAVDADELEELLTESWRLRAPAKLVAAFDDLNAANE